MKKTTIMSGMSFVLFLSISSSNAALPARRTLDFCKDWKFHLVQSGETLKAEQPNFDDSSWRSLNLPHDWSVELPFDEKSPAGVEGGALAGGIGWYRKSFSLGASQKTKSVFIEFDGVYRNSEVWINGRFLGIRPYGYSSFQYELTPYLRFGSAKNIIAVKVDNSKQPNSRFYSGSGIYRRVRMVLAEKVHVDHWGTYVTTPEVSEQSAGVRIQTRIRNQTAFNQPAVLTTVILDASGKEAARVQSIQIVQKDSTAEYDQKLNLIRPVMWSLDNPTLYKAVSRVECRGKLLDETETPFGVRIFEFDRNQGFFLNGKAVTIRGVCNHHDLGCLGAAVNTRALERQLEILKDMGCNGIRTSHNPPDPELLNLCDRMGFFVMDEAFDMWKIQKREFDYHLDWDAWHARDLEDMVLRDRNHPSVFVWSIGNEIPEQRDTSGVRIAKELCGIVRQLDTTRSITCAYNQIDGDNFIIRSNAPDLLGFNYRHPAWPGLPIFYRGKTFIGTETTSAIATRGHYDMPSDSVRIWPERRPGKAMNPDLSCSAYDNCHVPWGSTHEEAWALVKKYPFLTGMFIWTGFDYLGEPTPYQWPARSSYFGIVDLAGFPKDAYYLYQSEWTPKPVLHIFPHWNWEMGDTIDVWAYSNCQEVDLLLNGISLGAKRKNSDELHLVWRVPYAPGTLKAIGRTDGKDILVKEIQTAGKSHKISLSADRNRIRADGHDLSFVTVRIEDAEGILVPRADHRVQFSIQGEGFIAGVDNGCQTSLEPFKANYRKAFNGMCLAVIQSIEKAGTVVLTASSEGLEPARVVIQTTR